MSWWRIFHWWSMCDIDGSTSALFFIYFFLMKHLICPSLALGSQDRYCQVPCAPGAQRDTGPLSHCVQSCVGLVSSRRGGMVWDEPFVPGWSCRVPLGRIRGECAAYWICKHGRHRRERSAGRMEKPSPAAPGSGLCRSTRSSPALLFHSAWAGSEHSRIRFHWINLWAISWKLDSLQNEM